MNSASSIVRMTHARLGSAVIMRQPTGSIVADGARQLAELERRGAISRAESETAFDQIVRTLRTEIGAWKSPKERRKVGAALERASLKQLDIIDRGLLLAEAEHAIGRRSHRSIDELRAAASRDRTAILAMLRGFTRGND
jgi:hypothetical protein